MPQNELTPEEQKARRERLSAVVHTPPAVWAAQEVADRMKGMSKTALHVTAPGLVARDLAGEDALHLVNNVYVEGTDAHSVVNRDRFLRVRALEHFGFVQHLLPELDRTTVPDVFLKSVVVLEEPAASPTTDPELWTVRLPTDETDGDSA